MKHSLILAASLLATAAFAQQRPLTAGQPFVADRTASLGTRAPAISDRNVRLKNGQAPAPAKPAHKPNPTATAPSTSDAQAVALSDARATNASTSAGGAATINSPRAPVSTAYAAPITPTAPCVVGASGGLSVGPASVSGTGGEVRANCEIQEISKTLHQTGDYATAWEVQCEIPMVREARKRRGQLCWADTPAGIQAARSEPARPTLAQTYGAGAVQP